jgi:hypothetical protein
MEAYYNAWEQFYSTDHMIDVLKIWKRDHHYYKERLSFFAWYLYASRIERLHPMNCGFWTVRRRNDRRAGFPREAFVPFWLGRLNAVSHRLCGMVKLFFQLEEVWLRSRPKSAIEEALHELITKTEQDIIDWRDVKVKKLIMFYSKLRIEMPEIWESMPSAKVPSAMRLWFRKRNPFARAFTRRYAQRIWQRWYLHIWNPLKWIEVWLFECVNGLRFLTHLLSEGMEKKDNFYQII